MTTHEQPDSPPVRWWWGLALLAMLVFGSTAQSWLHDVAMGGSPRWVEGAVEAVLRWGTWAVLAPLIYRLTRRFPFSRSRWRSTLAALLIGCALFAVIRIAMLTAADGLLPERFRDIPPAIDLGRVFALRLTLQFGETAAVFFLLAGFFYLTWYYRGYRLQELREAQMEFQLARAQLQALRMQLQPHFLFNTLNAITALMYRDVAAADRMIAKLAEFLRMTMEVKEQEIPLDEEIVFLERYLDIEQVRLGERLAVHVEVDPAVSSALVPSLLLQPLVENAIKHGVTPRNRPVRVEVQAWPRDGKLCIRVEDDGAGAVPSRPVADGVGLSNTRARLTRLHGDRYRLTAKPRETGGFVVEMTFPLRN